MEHFTHNSEFIFPDSLFPEVQAPYPALPNAPLLKRDHLSAAYQRIVASTSASPENQSQNLSQFFRWARDVLDFHELHHGVPEVQLDFARTVVRHTAYSEETEGAKSPFTGPAHYLMGLWALFGEKNDTGVALEHFRIAGQNSFARSYYRLAVEFESRGDIKHWKECLTRGSDKGDSACCFRLAMALFQGQLGLARDPNVAFQLLTDASRVSDPDSPQPSYVLGLLLLGELPAIRTDGCDALEGSTGSLSESDRHVIAFKALERAAWLGFAPAQIRMGRAWQGCGKGFDSAIALRYFHHASRHYLYQCWRLNDVHQTSGEAELEVSKWFLSGCEVHLEANEPWAFRFGHVAACAGNTTAEFALGYFYEVGISVKKSTSDARFWYTEALKHGFGEARARLDELDEHPLDKSHHQKKLSLRRSNTRRLKDEFKDKVRVKGGRGMRSYSVTESKQDDNAMPANPDLEEVEEGQTLDGIKEVEEIDVANLAVPEPESSAETDMGVLGQLQNLKLGSSVTGGGRLLERIKEMKLEEEKRREEEELLEKERLEEEKLEKERLAEEKKEQDRLEQERLDLIERSRVEENQRREKEALRLAEALKKEEERLAREKEERDEQERLVEEAKRERLMEEERRVEAERHVEEERRVEEERLAALRDNESAESSDTLVSRDVESTESPSDDFTKSNESRRDFFFRQVRERTSKDSVNGAPASDSPVNDTPASPASPASPQKRISSMIIDSREISSAGSRESNSSRELSSAGSDSPLSSSGSDFRFMRDIVIPPPTSAPPHVPQPTTAPPAVPGSVSGPPSNTSSRSNTPSGRSTPRKPVGSGDGSLANISLSSVPASPERGRPASKHSYSRSKTVLDMENPPRLCSPAIPAVGASGSKSPKRLSSTPTRMSPVSHGTSPRTGGSPFGPGKGPYADYSPPVPPKDGDRSVSPIKSRPESPRSPRVSSLSAVEISQKLKRIAGKMVPNSPPKRHTDFRHADRTVSMSVVGESKDISTSQPSQSHSAASSPISPTPASPISQLLDDNRSSSPVDSIMSGSHSRSSTMMTQSSSGGSMFSNFMPNLPTVKVPRVGSPLKNPLSAKDVQPHVPVEPAVPRTLYSNGKGPRTFEEMGINPVTKEADECVIM